MRDFCADIIAQVSEIVLGKKHEIRLCLTCLFANGHLLIEDLPGIGKTTLAKSLAACLGLVYGRVQFTSDMLPGDILGVSVFEQKESAFVFHPGPIFTQVLLADEINRTTPKTQSALLEAMEERQVTSEGVTRQLPAPFFVIATQNPLEQSGVFSLPDSQLDRFLMRIALSYPGREHERQLLNQGDAHRQLQAMQSCMESMDIPKVQHEVEQVHAAGPLLEYALDLLEFTRTSAHFQTGLSPRAGLGLMRAAKSWAYIEGREHVLPEDVQAVMAPCLRHRLRSSKDYREISADRLDSLFREVPLP